MSLVYIVSHGDCRHHTGNTELVLIFPNLRGNISGNAEHDEHVLRSLWHVLCDIAWTLLQLYMWDTGTCACLVAVQDWHDEQRISSGQTAPSLPLSAVFNAHACVLLLKIRQGMMIHLRLVYGACSLHLLHGHCSLMGPTWNACPVECMPQLLLLWLICQLCTTYGCQQAAQYLQLLQRCTYVVESTSRSRAMHLGNENLTCTSCRVSS